MIILKQDDWVTKPDGSLYSNGDIVANIDSQWSYSGADSHPDKPSIQDDPTGVFTKVLRVHVEAFTDTQNKTKRKRSELIPVQLEGLAGGRQFRRSGSPEPATPDGPFPHRGYFVGMVVRVGTESTWFLNTEPTSTTGYRTPTTGAFYQLHGTADAGETSGLRANTEMVITRTGGPGSDQGQFIMRCRGDDRHIMPNNFNQDTYLYEHSDSYTVGDWLYVVLHQQLSWARESLTEVWVWNHGESAPTWGATPSGSKVGFRNCYNDNKGPFPKGPGAYVAHFQHFDQYWEGMVQRNYFGPYSLIEYDPDVAGEQQSAFSQTVEHIAQPGVVTPPPTATPRIILLNGSAASGQTLLKSNSTPQTFTIDDETNLQTAEWFDPGLNYSDTPSLVKSSAPFSYTNAVTPSAQSAGSILFRLRTTDINTATHLTSATINIIDDTGGGGTDAVLSVFDEGDGAIVNTLPGSATDTRNKWRGPAGGGTVPTIVSGKLSFGVQGQTIFVHVHDGRPKVFTLLIEWDPQNLDSRLAAFLGLTSQPVITNLGTNDVQGFGLMMVNNLVNTGAFTPNTHLQRLGMDPEDGSGIWDSDKVLNKTVYPGGSVDKSHTFRTKYVGNMTSGIGSMREEITDLTTSQVISDFTLFGLDTVGFSGRVFGIGAKKVQASPLLVTKFQLTVEEYF